MADSKSAGPCGRVGSSPTASTGALGSAHRFRPKGPRAGLSVVNAHCLGVAVARSPASVCKMGVVGKGGTCCFMCVGGVAVLWGPRPTGGGWCV